MADGVILTRAGLEVSVAATKTFVAQVAAIYLLALRLAELRGTLPEERRRELITDFKHLPNAITQITEGSTEAIDRVAEAVHRSEFFLYLGRHVGLAVCLEGALKLKEISYIATDANAAGKARPAQHLAVRFCAKEAVAKALGVEWWNPHDVEVVPGDRGPTVRLSGPLAELGVDVQVSLTHSRGIAGAVAVAT